MSVINLFFFITRAPKSDVCDVCFKEDNYLRTSPSDADVRQKALDHHRMLAECQREHLSEKRETWPSKPADTDHVVISMDMQQVIPIPKLPNQSAFFKRKVRIIIIKIFITLFQ